MRRCMRELGRNNCKSRMACAGGAGDEERCGCDVSRGWFVQTRMAVTASSVSVMVYLSTGTPGMRASVRCTSLCVGNSFSDEAKLASGVSNDDRTEGVMCVGFTIGRVCSSNPLLSPPERAHAGEHTAIRNQSASCILHHEARKKQQICLVCDELSVTSNTHRA